MTKQLEITLKNKSKLTLNWTDSSNLKTWLARQRTRSAWLLDKTDSEFFTEYQDWIQYYCSLIEGMGAFDLPKNANILDIGSGVGIIDLFLAKQFTGSITMLDKNEYQTK